MPPSSSREASITELLVPTVQDVLARGRAELVSVGFLLSLWSGSRALNVFIDTVSIMYGQKDVRGIIQLRALSLSLYTVGTLAGIVLLPLVLLGPSIIRACCRRSSTSCATSTGRPSSSSASLALTSLYHVSTPRAVAVAARHPGRRAGHDIWLLASYVVRGSLEASLGGVVDLRAAQSRPIVLLIWLYALAIAILIGPGLNAATATIWPVVLSDGAQQRVHWHPWSERAVLQVADRGRARRRRAARGRGPADGEAALRRRRPRERAAALVEWAAGRAASEPSDAPARAASVAGRAAGAGESTAACWGRFVCRRSIG